MQMYFLATPIIYDVDSISGQVSGCTAHLRPVALRRILLVIAKIINNLYERIVAS